MAAEAGGSGSGGVRWGGEGGRWVGAIGKNVVSILMAEVVSLETLTDRKCRVPDLICRGPVH